MELKLVGICSLWIASKFVDVEPLSCEECIDAAHGNFTRDQLVQGEKSVLETLDYKMFCQIPTLPLNVSPEMRNVCEYFLSYAALSYLFAFIDPADISVSVEILGQIFYGNGSLEEWHEWQISDRDPLVISQNPYYGLTDIYFWRCHQKC